MIWPSRTISRFHPSVLLLDAGHNDINTAGLGALILNNTGRLLPILYVPFPMSNQYYHSSPRTRDFLSRGGVALGRTSQLASRANAHGHFHGNTGRLP